MDLQRINKLVIASGYNSLNDYLLKFAMPLISVALAVGIFIPVMFPELGWGLSIVFFVIISSIVGAFPFVKSSLIKQDINQNLHFFITYAGTISTMKISRYILFKRIAQKKVYGEISKVFEKTLYLSKDWSFGFANSCRVMASRTPSKILADFLDRFAVVMDFGEELDVFLDGEQSAILEDYSVEYTKSLEVIKTLQELFMAISASFAFLVSTVILAPMLIQINVTIILIYVLIGLIVVDAGLILAVKSFIPKDDLFHDLPLKNRAQRKIKRLFFGCVALGLFMFISLLLFTSLSFVLVCAISITPFIYPGMLAIREENIIKKRDRQFPVFLRVFGSAIEVRNGGVISALKATQIHDFGVLEEMNINLYRRLRLGSDKFKSWYYYAVESGSNLVHNFSKIFSESVYLGGNAEKIGEIISKNIQHLLSLRKLRRQIVEGITGVFYGITVGISITVFVTWSIARNMTEMFTLPEDDSGMAAFTDVIFPGTQDINFSAILIVITIMLIVHSFVSSWIINIVGSGSNYSLFLNFVFMTWIIVILYLVVPPLINSVLPDVSIAATTID